jgi:hypothetical protein
MKGKEDGKVESPLMEKIYWVIDKYQNKPIFCSYGF